MAGTALRIAGLADALGARHAGMGALVPAIEARFAADGTIDDLERQVLEAAGYERDEIGLCAVDAEEQNGITTYVLGLFRAKPSNRRMREMAQDLRANGVDLGQMTRTA